MPELIGGLDALQVQITYPETARRAGIQGRVFVQFVVDERGTVERARVVRGIGGGCDEEALEAVRNARFTPGKHRGRPVKVRYVLPVTFRLNDGAALPELDFEGGGYIELDLAGTPPPALPDSVYEARFDLALELIRVSGSDEASAQLIDDAFEVQRQAMPHVPPAFFDAMEAEFDMEELRQLEAGVYAIEFTVDELAALIAFYRTDIGRRLAEATPTLQIRSQEVAMRYGEEVAQRALVRLEGEDEPMPDGRP